jgi:hypothetical protein
LASPTPKWALAQPTAKKENQPSLEDIVPHRTEGCGGVRNRFMDGSDVCASEADAKETQALAQSAFHRVGLRWTLSSNGKKNSEPA